MSTHSDLLLLREEEKTLVDLRTKLTDQLNRLKVEELALQSHIRCEQSDAMPVDMKPASAVTTLQTGDGVNLEELKLDLFNIPFGQGEEEEEEEEEEDEEEAMAIEFVERLTNEKSE